MTKLIFTSTFTLLCFFLCCAQNNSTQKDTSFYVIISDPAYDGFRVGREYDVKGKAQVPSGQLWILSHRKGIPQWWPQNEVTIDPISKEWMAVVSFGETRDIGRDFEILAILVNNQGGAFLYENIGKPILKTSLPNYKYSALSVLTP